MGCDIHIVVERRKAPDAKWIGLYATDFSPNFRRSLIAHRDYGFFTEVANVRGNSPTAVYPKNLPEDVSDLARAQYMSAPTDYHSASHMSAEDFCAGWLRANPNPKDVRPEDAVSELLGVYPDEDSPHEFRVVFWFDN